jgi:ComF family protein
MLFSSSMHAKTILTNLLYPPACAICSAPLGAAGSDLFCDRCARSLPAAERPLCERCGLGQRGAFDATVLCARCRARPPAFDRARSAWPYTGGVRTAVHQFKYRHRRRLGRWLAQTMARTAQASLPLEEVTLVLPVPLHGLKRRLKGFNHADELASTVARSLGKPYRRDALRRIRWTKSQTRLAGRARIRNVRGAFAATRRLVDGTTVLLVDDVLTSGSTAQACTRALKAAGARRVFVLTAARTPLA